MNFKWSRTSLERRRGVHPDLIRVSDKALSYGIMDITVLQDGGVRTVKRQRELVSKGFSRTLKSKHLIQKDGYGHAIDLSPFPIDWKNEERFYKLAELMKRAAWELKIKIEWGGEIWMPKFFDGPHYQLKTQEKK